MRLSQIVSFDECLVTRVWGFSPESWGAIGFPKKGTAEKWSGGGAPLRVICFVSHNAAEHIDERDRGLVLGVYELSPTLVDLENDNVLAPEHLSNSALRREDGRFRWPIGLRATKAWRFRSCPRTREAMPTSRRLSYDVSTDLVPISRDDFELLDQASYDLVEVPVYGIERELSRLADPIAIPSFVYMFACARRDMLQRLPGWNPGLTLVKIGCTSDVESRLGSFNDHPLAKIFGLKLAQVAQKYMGETIAAEEETRLLELAASIGRPASDLATEFFFVSDAAYRELQLRFSSVLRVA